MSLSSLVLLTKITDDSFLCLVVMETLASLVKLAN